MNNDFAEFAQGFRERTAKRLLEFEKTLAKAQDELQKSADKAVEQARREKGQVGRRQAGQRPRYSAAPERSRNASGRVQSVLRRG